MPLTAFVLFLLGMLSELIFLYEGAGGHLAQPGSVYRGGGRGIGPGAAVTLAPTRQALLGLSALAALLIVGLDLTGLGRHKVFIDTPGVSWIFILLGVGLLFSALAANLFLPRVNETAILGVQGLVLVGALCGGPGLDRGLGAALVAAPVVVGLILLIYRRVFHPAAKVLLYLWYLVSLLILPFQSGEAPFSAAQAGAAEAYTAGLVFIFLLVHGLFIVRFALIASSQLLPRNRLAVAGLMPRLFSDEQAPVRRCAGLAVALAAMLLANRALDVLPLPLALGGCSLLAVQLLGDRQATP